MLKISPEELETVQAILRQFVPEHSVRAFGSRVHGENLKPHSDLDLAIMNSVPLDRGRYAALTDAFSESDIPFKVDVVEWASISESFRTVIDRAYSLIPR